MPSPDEMADLHNDVLMQVGHFVKHSDGSTIRHVACSACFGSLAGQR